MCFLYKMALSLYSPSYTIVIFLLVVPASALGPLPTIPFDNATGCTCYNEQFENCLTPIVDKPRLCSAAPCSGVVCTTDPGLITGVCVKTRLTNQYYTHTVVPNAPLPPQGTYYCAAGQTFPVLQPTWVGREAGTQVFSHTTVKGAEWIADQQKLVLNQPNGINWASVTPQRAANTFSNTIATRMNLTMANEYGLNGFVIGHDEQGNITFNAAVSFVGCSFNPNTKEFEYSIRMIRNYLDPTVELPASLSFKTVSAFIDSAALYEQLFSNGGQVGSLVFTKHSIEAPDQQEATAYGVNLFFPTTSDVGVLQIIPTAVNSQGEYDYTFSADTNQFGIGRQCFSITTNNSIYQNIGEDVINVYAMCAGTDGSYLYYGVLDNLADMQMIESASGDSYPTADLFQNYMYIDVVPPMAYPTAKLGLQADSVFSASDSLITLSPRNSDQSFDAPYYAPSSAVVSGSVIESWATQLSYDYFPTNLPGTEDFAPGSSACGDTAFDVDTGDKALHSNCYAQGPLQSVVSQTVDETLYIGSMFLAVTKGDVYGEVCPGEDIDSGCRDDVMLQGFYSLYMLWKCTGGGVTFPQSGPANCVQVGLNGGLGWIDFTNTSLAFTSSFLTSDGFGNLYISAPGGVVVLEESNLEASAEFLNFPNTGFAITGPVAVESIWDGQNSTIAYVFASLDQDSTPSAPIVAPLRVSAGAQIQPIAGDVSPEESVSCAQIDDPTFGSNIFPLQVFPLQSRNPAQVGELGVNGTTMTLVIYSATKICNNYCFGDYCENTNWGYCGEAIYDNVAVPGIALCVAETISGSCDANLCTILMPIGEGAPGPTLGDKLLGILRGWANLEEAALLTAMFTVT